MGMIDIRGALWKSREGIPAVLNVGDLGKKFREARGDPGGGLCMVKGSLKSHSTTDPSSLPAKTSKAFCGLKQQHVGVDSHVSTLHTLVDMCACENRYAFE